MILGLNGKPLVIEKPNTAMRKGMQVEMFQLPKGAIVSKQLSREFHNRLQNDARLRERLETADRMTGTKSLCLALMERGEMSEGTKRAIEQNLDFGEKILRQRVESEGEALAETGKAYAGQ
jgi:hypothetical protein